MVGLWIGSFWGLAWKPRESSFFHSEVTDYARKFASWCSVKYKLSQLQPCESLWLTHSVLVTQQSGEEHVLRTELNHPTPLLRFGKREQQPGEFPRSLTTIACALARVAPRARWEGKRDVIG